MAQRGYAVRTGAGRNNGARGRSMASLAEDITNPDFLLQESDPYTIRDIKTITGIGVERPGYRIGWDTEEGIAPVRVVKVVSPLDGQGPADPLATGRYANYNLDVVSVRRVRVARSVPPNTGSKVVRPPQTAIRRMSNRGQGVVEYF